jgi:uncharacterized protein YjaZ
MSAHLHLLNASGRLSPYIENIKEAFTECVDIVSVLLPVKDVDVVVRAGRRVIPEIGIGGFSPSAEAVYLTMDPDNPHFQDSLEREFVPILGHELHHCARHSGPGYGHLLGEALVTEGLACHFETELRGGDAPFYAHALDEVALQAVTARALDALECSYDHRSWFFGATAQNLPRHAGYSLGFRIVGRYLADYGTLASHSWAVPARDVLVLGLQTF